MRLSLALAYKEVSVVIESSKISHIGIAVSNLDAALQTYKLLGFKLQKIEKVSDMDVRVAFLPIRDTRIELLEPLSKESVIAKFIEKKGEGVHHICIEVQDIHKALKELKDQKFNLVYETPKRGAENTLVSFVHPKSTHGVLIELCQRDPSASG